jgi:two-component system NtrC family response regulator
MKRIVIIDGQKSYWAELTEILTSMGHQIIFFNTWHSAYDTISSHELLLLIINASLPDANGIEMTWTLRQNPGAPEILVISDSANADDAEQAIRSGAWDYLIRPLNVKFILPLINRIIDYSTSIRHIKFQDEFEGAVFEGIAGESPKIKACLTIAQQAAKSDVNVLIRGDTGTGKELLAWAIHKNSSRANNNFVVVDCAALPETLVESTLMGHERGAFTGADKVQNGLIKQADGGTLFLDEVGELPFSIQKSFLRVLEERRFRRVGGKQEIKSDFRLLSASNKNLDLLVQQGKFREDLLFRLRSFMIELPPLRERKEDIKIIVQYHLLRLCTHIGKEIKQISDEYLNALMIYSWPGNVRELVNALDRSIVAARNEPVLFPQHLPTYIRVFLAREKTMQQNFDIEAKGLKTTKPLQSLQELRNSILAQAEADYLRSVMNTIKGDIAQACHISGLSRSRLYSLLKKYRIPVSRYK